MLGSSSIVATFVHSIVMPTGSESSSGHSDSESSEEIEAPPRKRRKLDQKKGRKSTKTPIQRLNAERKKWCQLKERKQTAIDKLKKKQKRAMKKVVDEHKREMKAVKDDHDKKITKQRGKMESIMKEIEEDSDVTDDVELCRFCALVHELGEEEEWKQCSGDKCENISCEDCSTEFPDAMK